jgi:polysaccharide pyruvyl transferase CsaB
MSRTAVLAGYYGFGNTGDEAILASILAGLRQAIPSAKAIVLSGDPEKTRAEHGVDAIGWRDLAALSDAISACDLVILGGGGLFQDYWGLDTSTLLTPRHGEIAFYAGPAVLAALARKPLALFALGFGPLSSKDALRYTRAVCQASSSLSVRDAGSRDLLVSAGVDASRITVSADAAFTLRFARADPREILAAEGVQARSPIAGVALRPWSIGVDPAAWENALVEALDLFVERTGSSLLFVPFEKSPWGPKDDFELAARIRSRLRQPGCTAALSRPLPPGEAAGLLAGCDLVLGMRLHSLVFSAASGVPAVGLAYDPKVAALMDRLGTPEMTVGLSELSPTLLCEKMERALADRQAISGKLLAAAASQKRLAEEDLASAAAMLADPPAAPPVTEELVSLFDDAVRANLRQHAAAEGAHRHEKALLEQRVVEARQELAAFQTSRVWKAANLYWRARRAAGRWLRPLGGRAPSDWAGPDEAAEAARRAAPIAIDNRHEVIWFAASEWDRLSTLTRERLTRYADAGHRVYCVAPAPREAGAPYTHTERAHNLFEVSLAGDAANALDALRLEQALCATASIVENAAQLPVARRLRAERGWPLVDATGEPDLFPDPADLILDPAAAFEDVARAVALVFPKASVVVVTRDNRDLNRLCLESLKARTEWPNLEVIVVDNGSKDGTRELLGQLQASMPNLSVIRNEENRGFAAAVNQGFSAASGRYLVTLNNDTVLTRGWLTALLRHLHANPKLGLVGPVSNAISNEARVEVGYKGLDDLSRWATEWVRSHDGEDFPIPMLAFFCVALKREAYEAVGPLDERFGPGMFEDDDYNRRAREQGWEIRCARDSFVHHWQKASFRKLGEKAYLALYEENRRKYEEKWGASAARGKEVAPRAGLSRYASQLDAVRQRAKERKGVVIFLPSVGWGIHLFQRPHHLARAFAKAGWLAIFDCSNAQDQVDGFKEIEPNLFLFRGPAAVLAEIPAPLLWSFPYNYAQRDTYPKDARVVYDWIDDLSVFPYDRKLLDENHERGLAEATVVASVARRLHEKALARRSDAILLQNGVEYERFASETAPASGDKDLQAFVAAGRPIAGYYGALAEWFDYELLDEAARLAPGWSFLLIGPMYDRSLQGRPMLRRENVRWIGPRDYHLLPSYLAHFDVATIPFRINDITTATSPLKLYEYFAGGKPVVTTPMPECEAYPEVAIARDAPSFVAALESARRKGQDPSFRARLRELGRENSWDARVRTVLAALAKSVSPAPHEGRCNICGRDARFLCSDPALYRESLYCEHCLSTSRYRSIARGLLEAIRGISGIEAASLAELPRAGNGRRVSVYDTQVPFSTGASAYPIPGLLAKCDWIDLHLSTFRPGEKPGAPLSARTTNENLERLSFPDRAFDVVVTSDVMEHVRLEDAAHREIRRVLKPGGFYVFTVPHFRDRKTVERIRVVDPADPSRDEDLLEREYHGDANSEEGRALTYRSFGTDLDEKLRGLGFEVTYTKEDVPGSGILDTELFLCRLRP